MRTAIIFSLLVAVSVLVFTGCNSSEGSATRARNPLAQSTQPPQAQETQPAQNPTDKARRINAEELHDLWEKNEVLIVDTRNEAAYKQSHIKGAILIPSNEFEARADELPKNKMIVAYCT